MGLPTRKALMFLMFKYRFNRFLYAYQWMIGLGDHPDCSSVHIFFFGSLDKSDKVR